MEITRKPAPVSNTRYGLSHTMKRILDNRYIYLMLLPGIIYFLIFKYVPMYGIQLAFRNFTLRSPITGEGWVGLENFVSLWREPEFWTAFYNTLIISFLKIILDFPVPIILAILINEVVFKGYKRVLQTVLTFPHFLSWVIVAGISINLLGNTGAVNNLLSLMGFERIPFLVHTPSFRYLLVFSEIWKEAGWSSILYLAAIAGIDTSLYEAATVDGANRFQKMIHITWPGISGMVIVLLILKIGNVMDAGFIQVLNMYNPVVYKVADILDTYVYRISFERGADFSFSTAVGLFKGICNFLLLFTANKIAQKIGQKGVI